MLGGRRGGAAPKRASTSTVSSAAKQLRVKTSSPPTTGRRSNRRSSSAAPVSYIDRLVDRRTNDEGRIEYAAVTTPNAGATAFTADHETTTWHTVQELRRKSTTLARESVDVMMRELDQDPRMITEWAKRAQKKKDKKKNEKEKGEKEKEKGGEKEKEKKAKTKGMEIHSDDEFLDDADEEDEEHADDDGSGGGGGGGSAPTSVAAAASAAAAAAEATATAAASTSTSSGVKKEHGAVSAGGGAAAASDDCKVVVISDSSDDDVMVVEPPQPKTKVQDNGKERGKGKGKAQVKKAPGKAQAANYDSDEEDDSDLDDDAGEYRSVSDDEDADDDLQVVGVKGQFALRDFPHTREHCVAKKATFGTEDHCSNCFCMVCDSLVKECKDWKKHCKATFSSPTWRAARQAAKNGGTGGAAAAAAAAADGGGSRSSTPLWYRRQLHHNRSKPDADDVPFNCSAFLESIQQVYPEEAAKPKGLAVSSLRHYQKQSIAFMLANERATHTAGQPKNPRIGTGPERKATLSKEVHISPWEWKPNVKGGNIRGGWLCDEVGMGKTMCCIATILSNPCTDATTDFTAVKEWMAKDKAIAHLTIAPRDKRDAAQRKRQDFNRYKKVRRTPEEIQRRYPNWHRGNRYYEDLDEDEMFYKDVLDPTKTEMFTKLAEDEKDASAAYNTARNKYIEELKKLGPKPATKHKATVVVMPPTLLGQWLDEFKKYAPSLKVYSAHAGTGGADYKKFKKSDQLARDADVILVSKHLNTLEVGKDTYFGSEQTIGGDDQMQFHRVIVDEVHVGDPQKKWAIAPLRWGITGTPASKSPSDLAAVAKWLGQTTLASNLKDDSRRSFINKDMLAERVASLKMMMIRHTKSMQIGGDTALVLPTLKSKSIMLNMSAVERSHYTSERARNLQQRQIQTSLASGATMMHLDMHLKATRDAASGLASAAGTKMQALKKALIELKTTDPYFQVIVFTRTASAQVNIATMVKSLGISTYELTSAIDMKKRHNSIREFQTKAKKPRVCVASVNIGSVGVTLTAATRVYLMEPSIDPAAEVQCAGRIHRLGQTKEVLFTRFCFSNTIDEATVKLHEKFANNLLTIDDDRRLSAEGVKLITSM